MVDESSLASACLGDLGRFGFGSLEFVVTASSSQARETSTTRIKARHLLELLIVQMATADAAVGITLDRFSADPK